MLTTITVQVSTYDAQASSAFDDLGNLLGLAPFQGAIKLGEGRSALHPAIYFTKNPKIGPAKIIFNTDVVNPQLAPQQFELPEGLMSPTGWPKSVPKPLLELGDVAQLLKNRIAYVDHIGVNVPRTVAREDWEKATGLLMRHTLYEYPAGYDGYDPSSARWLFVVPRGLTENPNRLAYKDKRTPKFELVYDDQEKFPGLQIDLQTHLSQAQIRERFPHATTLPGLEDVFCSVRTTSPWAGIGSLRLDLRYADHKGVNDWTTGAFLTQGRQPLRRGDPALTLPQQVLAS